MKTSRWQARVCEQGLERARRALRASQVSISRARSLFPSLPPAFSLFLLFFRPPSHLPSIAFRSVLRRSAV